MGQGALRLRMRDFALILSSFVGGFYVGYFVMSASSFCDPIVNESAQHLSNIVPVLEKNDIINIDQHQKVDLTIIQSNLFDETFEWQYFKNRNTEISPYIIPHHKTLMCLIPKNAISMWKMVLLRIHNKEWWLTTQGKIHAMDNGLGDFRLWDKNFSYVDSIMNNNEWYKAVFIRDPLERALSAVLDKGYTLKIDWASFHEYLIKTDVHMIDQHFRHQHMFCDLYKYKDKYHIFSFHNKTHRKVFLEDNNLWKKYGETQWSIQDHNGKNNNNGSKIKHSIVDFENIFRRHSHNSEKHILKAYTIEKTALLLKYYHYDYILFNLSLPEWICQVISKEYPQITILLPQQMKKKNSIQFRRTTKLETLRGSVATYAQLVQLYTTLKMFPPHLLPSCMKLLTYCVEYGQCAQTFNLSLN